MADGMAVIADLAKISGQAGPGTMLPEFPEAPLPQSILKAFPDLAEWQKQNTALRTEWLRKMTFNLNQP